MDIDIYVSTSMTLKKQGCMAVWAKRAKGKGIGIQCHGTPSAWLSYYVVDKAKILIR